MAGFAADVLLFVHFGFVVFVVGGLIVVWVGAALRWEWVRNPWFRVGHLLAIGFVVVQSWLGIICPLTDWEMQLRERAGEETYEGSFISHWLDRILYIEAPWEAFLAAYTIFGLLVLGSLFVVRPRFRSSRLTGEFRKEQVDDRNGD
ncbi:MAG: DUF2784 domain-containing protein [Verrucomicrobiota bacterium]